MYIYKVYWFQLVWLVLILKFSNGKLDNAYLKYPWPIYGAQIFTQSTYKFAWGEVYIKLHLYA